MPVRSMIKCRALVGSIQYGVHLQDVLKLGFQHLSVKFVNQLGVTNGTYIFYSTSMILSTMSENPRTCDSDQRRMWGLRIQSHLKAIHSLIPPKH